MPKEIKRVLENDPGVDIFLEVVPVGIVIPDTDFDINSGLGVRYFFK